MFITREADYGVRTVRALASGKKQNITAICEQEAIPRQFAYKILKKLNHAGIVSIIRGVNGGYVLNRDLKELTLYDILAAIDPELFLNKCLTPGFVCERNLEDGCLVHRELGRIQKIMEEELKKKTVYELLDMSAKEASPSSDPSDNPDNRFP